MKRLNINFFILILFLAFTSCKKTEEVSKKESKEKLKIVTDNKEKKVEIYNDSKTMMLHLSKRLRNENIIYDFEFKVYDAKTKKLLKKGTYTGVEISWYNDSSLKLVPYIGIEKKEEGLLKEAKEKKYKILKIK